MCVYALKAKVTAMWFCRLWSEPAGQGPSPLTVIELSMIINESVRYLSHSYLSATLPDTLASLPASLSPTDPVCASIISTYQATGYVN